MESLVAWVKVTKKRHVRVIRLDADEQPDVVRRLRVRAIPSLLLVHEDRVLGRLEGRSTGRQIDDLIDRHASASRSTDSAADHGSSDAESGENGAGPESTD